MTDTSLAPEALAPWKILIADDDHDVHAATRMALRGTRFRGRELAFIDTYSGAETLAALQENPDTAVIFLDVIMETDDAGLGTAQRIREYGFNLVRIIIRTGFPGQAPERKVIVDYDIHDYKEKTGLSVQKLFVTVISALRAYDDLVALENHRRGLMSVLESVSWFDFNAVQRYAFGMLAEFFSLARFGAEGVVMVARPSTYPEEVPAVVAATSNWPSDHDPISLDNLASAERVLILDSLAARRSLWGGPGRTLYSHHHGIELVVFASGDKAFINADEVLLDVFLTKLCQAIGNQRIFTDMMVDRDSVLRGLALRAEGWNKNAQVEMDALIHLSAAIADRLHTTLGFPDEVDSCFLRDIGIAATLHDLGHEAIPAVLLTKASIYDPDERRLMQTHVAEGLQSLATLSGHGGRSGALALARDVIAGHHENFDGSGYPQGVCGEAIPLAARIVALADAYIAMTSPRPHRPAMEAAAARAQIRKEEGRQFDPRIVQAFFEVIDNAFEG